MDNAVAEVHRVREAIAWRARREHVSTDAIIAPIRGEILGWRAYLVEPDPACWRRALALIVDAFLKALAIRQPEAGWQALVRRVLAILDSSEDDEAAVEQLAALFTPHLARIEARETLITLRQAELKVAALRLPADHPDAVRQREDVLSNALWRFLARLDRVRFDRIRDEVYTQCPRTSDPEMPDLIAYVRRLDTALLRGVDLYLVQQYFHSRYTPAQAQILGPREILEDAVVQAIQEAEPNIEGPAVSWQAVVTPTWIMPEPGTNGASSPAPDPLDVADRVVTWLQSLRQGHSYMIRTELVNIIDREWSKLLDETSVFEHTLARDPSVNSTNYHAERVQRLTKLLQAWRSGCTLALIQACDRLMRENQSEGVAPATPPEPGREAKRTQIPAWSEAVDALIAAIIPVASDASRGHDGAAAIGVGSLVRLGRHEPVDGERNWAESMEPYVGRVAMVVEEGWQDHQGCDVVKIDLDHGEHVWRVANLTPVTVDQLDELQRDTESNE